VSALTIAEKRQIELSNMPPREHHGSWRGETMVFICLCG